MNAMLTSEVLDLAADKVQEHGWRQGDGWEDRGAGLCLEGGIAAAVGGLYYTDGQMAGYLNTSALTRCPAYKAVQGYRETDRDLWLWNDVRGRTQEDVIAVLRAAAAVERAKEAAHAPEKVAAA